MRTRHAAHLMGTVFSFDVPAGTDLDDALRWLHRVDALFSTYDEGSEISRLARGELGMRDCDPLVRDVRALCEDAEARSGGFFSARYGGPFDPTGLVKGWAVEAVGQLLSAAGVVDYCVNGGGDIQLAGRPAPGERWRTGVSDPLRPGELIAVVEAGPATTAVATSGPAERGCHIRDPRTGEPADGGGLASVTVLAEGLTAADAWATAAYAMGSEAAREWLEGLPGVEALGVTTDRGTWRTSGLSGVRIAD
ncbi:FAD:protein FMN transferase [Streptomyces sp. NPDC051940]|uniref:FAD:protein FMN transferase n=1 Tax=Streptomyces sp. NPDC051940 TaxID=3155675 RepID=UPI00341C3BEA